MNQGYMQQKRISGRQQTYKWQDPQPTASDAPGRGDTRLSRPEIVVEEPISRRARREARQDREQDFIDKRREELKTTLAMCIVLVFVVCGVFAVIGRLSQVSAQSKYNDYLSKEITSLKNTLQSTEKELEHERSEDVIRTMAEQVLGMSMPKDEEIACLRSVTRYTNAGVQTAEGSVSSR